MTDYIIKEEKVLFIKEKKFRSGDSITFKIDKDIYIGEIVEIGSEWFTVIKITKNGKADKLYRLVMLKDIKEVIINDIQSESKKDITH